MGYDVDPKTAEKLTREFSITPDTDTLALPVVSTPLHDQSLADIELSIRQPLTPQPRRGLRSALNLSVTHPNVAFQLMAAPHWW